MVLTCEHGIRYRTPRPGALGVPRRRRHRARGRPVRGGQPVRACGRPARRDRRTGAPHHRGRARRRAARRHRHRQVGHHGVAHRAAATAHAGDGAQQDAGRAAGQRAAGDVAQQRRRVLRVVLRLLPTRGVHRPDGHLHREGQLDQRRRRAATALGDLEPAVAAGRGRGRVGVLHLRPRHPAVLPGPLGRAQGRRRGAPRRLAAAAGRRAVQPQRHGVHQGIVPGARRHRGDHPVVRGTGRAHRVLRRRDRGALLHAPADR